jgi:hypothetical protein
MVFARRRKKVQTYLEQNLERTILLRFLGIILKVLRLEIFIYSIYITNQFAQGVSKGDFK